MSWQDSWSKSDAGRARCGDLTSEVSSTRDRRLLASTCHVRQVLTREDFAARREAAENAKKAWGSPNGSTDLRVGTNLQTDS